jgi:acyl-homoserine lactone synthase
MFRHVLGGRAQTKASAVDPHAKRSAPNCAVHIVTAENRRLYRRQLEASFRLRHDVYVHERKWMDFYSPDGREVDEYDTEDAVYFLAIEHESDKLLGSARLLPTVRKPLLREFRSLTYSYPMPRSPSILHLSRHVVRRDRREGGVVSPVTLIIRTAIQEFCLSENIEQLTLLVAVALLPNFLELGWNPQPLGLPTRLWDTSCVAAMLDISEVALRKTQAAAGVTGSMLVRQGITRPLLPVPPNPSWLC